MNIRKWKKNQNSDTDSKKRCFVCGNSMLRYGFAWLESENDDLDTTKYLCMDCVKNGMIAAHEISKKTQEEKVDFLKRSDYVECSEYYIEDFVSKHGWKYFEDTVSEYCNPNPHIAFDFKREQIYIKQFPLRGIYRIINFSDVQNCVVYPRFTRKVLKASYLRDGKTYSYYEVNDTFGEYGFEKLIDCFGLVLMDRYEEL